MLRLGPGAPSPAQGRQDADDEPTQSTTEADASDPLIGAILGQRYRVLGLLARGGMGRIYRAEQVGVGRQVALKTLHPTLAEDAGEEFRKRFLLEAATLARLRHPNTVTLYDYGYLEDARLYYIAMELLSGRTVSQIIREDGPMEVRRALWVAFEVSRSLSEAHGLGVVHRDLKPSNVMVMRGTDGDRVKVLDFGIVKVHEDDSPELTRVSQIIGSPRYMSPEQVRHEPIDCRSDIYALGILLFEMLAGRVPFRGRSAVETMLAHVEKKAPSVQEVSGRELPRSVEAIVRCCLQKRPDDRYTTARQFQRAIQDALREVGEEGQEITSAAFSATYTHTIAQPPPPPAPAVPPLRAVWLALGAGLAIIGLVGAITLLRPHTSPLPPPAPVASSPGPAGAPAAAPEPVPVTISISSAPSGAELWLGDQRLGTTPYPLVLTPELIGASLELRLAGYEKTSWTVPRVTAPSDFSFPLRPLRSAATPRPAPTRPASPPAEPAASGDMEILLSR